MPLTVAALLEAAHAEVPKISVEDAMARVAEGALLLDVRDAPELQMNGRAQGAHHIPRGMLEFRADPSTQFHDKEMRFDRPIILHCASGGRAALAGKVLKDMGYGEVFNVGGYADWQAGGGPVIEPVDKGM